jgi:hypothetical protein
VTSATADEAYTYDVDATDADDDWIDYYLDSAPAGMFINQSTGQISWVPDSGQVGDHDVTVRAQDWRGASDTQTFTITVAAA